MRLSAIYRRKAPSTTQIVARIQRRLKFREEEAFLKQASTVENEPTNQLESMLAASFMRENASNFHSYQRQVKRLREARADKEANEEQTKSGNTVFPYKLQHSPEIFSIIQPNEAQKSNETVQWIPDRGFFVRGDKYYNEYVAATADELPEDEQNSFPYKLHGPENPAEVIDFQDPYQATKPNMSTPLGTLEDPDEIDESNEWRMSYGTEDPKFKISKHLECNGCGATLHCSDSALPGFVPVELLQTILKRHKRHSKTQINELCRRCYMLKEYDFLLNVNVAPVDYSALMGHLKLIHEALILLVVDMTDIRGSLHKELPLIIGDRKPMIVIGNKVDLLPPDAEPGYLKNARDILYKELELTGFTKHFNVLSTHLVSAKTGFGVEDLISEVYLHWIDPKGGLRGHIYVVGCTNAGKSTLFNTFLQSDLCKVRAIDLVERVTTSIWPGTTLSLLKFPVMVPTSRRLEMRRRRLLSGKAWAKKERRFQLQLFSETRDPKYLALSGHVDSTFKEAEIEAHPMSNDQVQKTFMGGDVSEERAKKTHSLRLDDPVFALGKWCYDTPGTVNKDQILDLLTLEELIRVIPRSLIVPRTVVCSAGDSLLIGGLARIDVLDVFPNKEPAGKHAPGNPSIHLTVFASDQLPLNVLKTRKVDDYLSKRLGSELLGAPLGDSRRLALLPLLESKTFSIYTRNSSPLRGSNDVVLSSIGWVLVTTHFDTKISAYTPGGRGIALRDPLHPSAMQMKGSRIPGTQMYNTRIFVPRKSDRKRQRP